MCESGIISNVYGYDQTTLFTQMRANFENFYVLGVTVDWCPSNIRGVTMDLNQQPQGVVGPYLFSDDPDNYSQNNFTDD